MIKRFVCLFLSGIMMISFLTGCTSMYEGIKEDIDNYEVADTEKKKLEDNDYLYANEDDCSVITMYLTVTTGNAAENTNHTWKEVNAYSVYDYEEMGVERYGVNGLLQVGDENGPLEGELGYGQYAPNATVTIRGQSSSVGGQKSYKISIQDGKGKWNDQTIINLNKHVFDGLRFRNKLMYDLLEEMPDTIALQTQFVHLYVKDNTEGGSGEFEDYGLYTQVEQPNRSFLKRHGFDANGHLYKLNLFSFNRYEDVIKLRSDADYDEAEFERLIEIKGDTDHSKLIAMLEDLNNDSISIQEVVDKWFEKDNLFSWLAFQLLTGNYDTINRNALIYSPQNENTWYFISWDCDAGFRRTELMVQEKLEESTWQSGLSNYWGNILFQRIFKDATLRKELDTKIQEYRQILTEENLRNRIQAYARVTKPYLYSGADVTHAPITLEEFEAVCEGAPKEIESNYNRYLDSLNKPMPFYLGVLQKQEDGYYIRWDSSYDFNMGVIKYRYELSQNCDMSNPICVVEDLVIPEYTYKADF